MKIISFLLLLFASIAFADFESDLESIASFKTEEFESAKNYQDEAIKTGILSDEFVGKLLADEKLLRYFYVCYLHYHFDKRYKVDKVFTSAINAKFEKKDLTDEQERSLKRSLASLVFTDKIENLKSALPENDRESDEYFLRTMIKLDGARLR